MGRITASRKQLKPDPIYGSLLAAKFINCLMHDGKKSTAQKVFYDALDIVKEKIPDVEPIEVFTQAVENVKPAIEVRALVATGFWPAIFARSAIAVLIFFESATASPTPMLMTILSNLGICISLV